MPQIKIIINPANKKPVEYTGKVQNGWKCPSTGNIFVRKDQYVKHLKTLAKERINAKKRAKFEAEREAFWANMRKTVRNAKDLEQFVKDNWQAFVQNAIRNERWGDKFERAAKWRVKRGLSVDIPELLWFKVESLNWSDSVSNSHNCPLNGVTNWGHRDKNAPISYPGWTGKISYQTTDEDTNTYEFGGDMWKGTGVNTGTGGYASNYYYYIELFAEDWAGMAEEKTLELLTR